MRISLQRLHSVLLLFGGIILCLLLSILLLWKEYFLVFDENLHLYFFEIPLGDAFLLKTPHGKTIVIDGGIDATVLEKIAPVRSFWQKKIDLLVLTHPDLDHLAGAKHLLEKYRIENIFLSGAMTTSPVFAEFLDTIEHQKIPIFLAEDISHFSLDGLFFAVLSPLESPVGNFTKSINNTSLVLKGIFQETSFLFTGDIEEPQEQKLLHSGLSLNSDLLQVPHHGSKGASSLAFLRAVNPDVAVISAGTKNRFGHPHEEVLDRLRNFSVITKVTKSEGTIEVLSDGKILTVAP